MVQGKSKPMLEFLGNVRIRDVQCHVERILERFKPYWAFGVKVVGEDVLKVRQKNFLLTSCCKYSHL